MRSSCCVLYYFTNIVRPLMLDEYNHNYAKEISLMILSLGKFIRVGLRVSNINYNELML